MQPSPPPPDSSPAPLNAANPAPTTWKSPLNFAACATPMCTPSVPNGDRPNTRWSRATKLWALSAALATPWRASQWASAWALAAWWTPAANATPAWRALSSTAKRATWAPTAWWTAATAAASPRAGTPRPSWWMKTTWCTFPRAWTRPPRHRCCARASPRTRRCATWTCRKATRWA